MNENEYQNEHDLFNLAEVWYSRVSSIGDSHYTAAQFYSKMNLFFGLPTLIMSTIVGTTIFSTLQNNPNQIIQILLGILSLTSAVLTALQSFLNFNDKAEKYRKAGALYNAIGRDLELLLARKTNFSCMSDIKQKMDKLATTSPHIPEFVYKIIERRRKKFKSSVS